MDSFELNKIIAAILMVALLVIGLGKLADGIFQIKKPETKGYKVELNVEPVSNSNDVKKEEKQINISELLALGDLAHGEKVFKKCAACHSINAGGGNKIGPALYNVIGRKAGAVQEYKYSKAMIAYGKDWSFQEMNSYLIKPQAYIKGTKMAFAGLRKEKDRASVILYMNKNSDNPLPLP